MYGGDMLKSLRLCIIVLVSGLILAGCTSTPTTSGYLSDYSRLKPTEHLEEYWADTKKIKKSDAPNIYLGEVSAAGISDKENVKVTDCIAWLRKDLLAGTAVSNNQSTAKYRLDVAITYMDPGSASARVLAGEFGAGHAKVQVEGKVFDVKSGQQVAAFAERRRSSGDIGIDDLGGDASASLVDNMIKSISKDVNSELLSTFSSN
jgi:hypothetical protein